MRIANGQSSCGVRRVQLLTQNVPAKLVPNLETTISAALSWVGSANGFCYATPISALWASLSGPEGAPTGSNTRHANKQPAILAEMPFEDDIYKDGTRQMPPESAHG